MDIVTFNSVLQDACSVRKTANANKLRLLASKKGLKLDGMTYRILVSGYAREGSQKEVELVLNEMLDKGFVSDLATYNRLMNGFSNS